MELVIRGVAVYAFVYVVVRAAGKRQLSEMTAFDAVLLLFISEVLQQALVGSDDFSFSAGMILVVTLVGMDIALSLLKRRFERVDRILEGTPVILLENGRLLQDNMHRERVDASDILHAARQSQGIERLDQIKFAVLEKTGSISIIPASAG